MFSSAHKRKNITWQTDEVAFQLVDWQKDFEQAGGGVRL
jgi:hypothetical protein